MSKLSYFLFGAILLATPASAQPAATLADLAFIAGHWQGEPEGAFIEEIWSAPNGNTMMGSFRYMQEGEAVFFEMMTIDTIDPIPTLRIKHFSAGLIAWEEKAEVHLFPLIRVDGHEAVFEQADGQKRLIYRQTGEEMVVILEEMKAGAWTAEHFPFRRAVP
ncbi:MAG: DUF6265 family protein [Rhodothermales bacterium]|nr:DUF6265 family protein [Rhodothermales bacterium]